MRKKYIVAICGESVDKKIYKTAEDASEALALIASSYAQEIANHSKDCSVEYLKTELDQEIRKLRILTLKEYK